MPETESTVTEEALLQQLGEMDREGTIDLDKPVEVKPKEEAPAPEVKPEEKKEEAPEEPKEQDSSLKKDTPAEDKAKSKWAANEERKAKTWQEINAEKEAIKAEKAKVEAEKAEIARLKDEALKAKVGNEPFRDERGFTAKDYKDAAKVFQEKGEAENAKAAEALATELVAKEQTVRQQKAQEEFGKKWSDNYAKLSDQKPDLRDPKSELYQETMKVLKDPEFGEVFTSKPDGLKFAVKAAELNLQAKTFDGTVSELKKLKADYETLQKKLSIGSGPPASPIKEDKPFDQLSLKEQEKRLEQMLYEQDKANGLS